MRADSLALVQNERTGVESNATYGFVQQICSQDGSTGGGCGSIAHARRAARHGFACR